MKIKLKALIIKTIPIYVGLVVLSLLAFSCGADDMSVPSDINLSISIQGADENNPHGDGTGHILCMTTAKNAVRYAYSFDGGDLLESSDGKMDYTFNKQGINNYSVLVFAYSSSGESINKTQFVQVFHESATRTLLFADEFEIDGPVDSQKWALETNPPNNGSWWNGEKQHYTDRLDNAYVSDGTLKIVAKKEQYSFAGSTKSYTSARLNSKFEFTYGRIDVRAKLPKGVGTWPAIWTLGSNITSVGWPACGEIDIMEHWGHIPTKVSGAIHTMACSGVTNCEEAKIGEKAINDYDSAFHIYSIDWTSEAIRFNVDNQLIYSYNPPAKTNENWPFYQNQFILLNVAMGADWFNIDPNFNQSTMEIDYVRVYQ